MKSEELLRTAKTAFSLSVSLVLLLVENPVTMKHVLSFLRNNNNNKK